MDMAIPLPYTVVDCRPYEKRLCLTICFPNDITRFQLNAMDEDMEGTRFAKWRQDSDRTYFRTSDWRELGNQLILPCILQFKQLIQPLLRKHGGLDNVYDYYHAPQFSIKFVARGIGHSAELLSGPIHAPICSLEPLLLDKLSLPPGIPLFDARRICIVPGDPNPHAVPSKVQQASSKIQFFKPCTDLRVPDFAREVSLLCRIQALGLHEKLRVSNILGIVTVNDDTEAVGMLLEWIPGRVLADDVCINDRHQHNKWKAQVEYIVKKLHLHDIVWGDVNPHNILINDASDACIIDFGGSCNASFIDEKNLETRTGDWQGVRKIFDEWLISKMGE